MSTETDQKVATDVKPGELLADTDKDLVGSSVMISYSRKDKAFVKNIYDALAVDDRNIWVDWEVR